MEYDWKQAVKEARRNGFPRSPTVDNLDRIKFYLNGDKLMLTAPDGTEKEINTIDDLDCKTVYFYPGKDSDWTLLNTYQEAMLDAWTQAILRGEICIEEPYSCVNRLGNPPLPNAKKITPLVPVPMKITKEQEYYVKTRETRVERENVRWGFDNAFVEEDTGPGPGRTKMDYRRIYMCGGITPAPSGQ